MKGMNVDEVEGREDEAVETVSLNVLQAENRVWADKNFPERTLHQPLWGLGEESGEIAKCVLEVMDMPMEAAMADPAMALLVAMIGFGKILHANLKREQNIRGTAGEHRENARKALQGLLVALEAAFPEVDLLSFLAEARQAIHPFDYLKFSKPDAPHGLAGIVDGLGDLLVFSADFANLAGVDLQEALDTTWNAVRKRDWTKNRETGQAA